MSSKNNNRRDHRPAQSVSTKQKPEIKQQHQKEKETKRSHRLLVNEKSIPFITLLLFVLYVVYQTLLANRSVIWKLHDQSLFLTDLTYLEECLSNVGGLSVYIATFFNDFFFIPWLGITIYTSLLLLVTWTTFKVFDLKGWLLPLAMIPALLILLMLTQNGYMIFWIKLKGFVYVAILGILVSLTGALLGKTSRKPLIQSLLAILFTLVAYPIAGAYGLMGTLLFATFSLKNLVSTKKYAHLLPAGVALLAIALVPLVYDQWVFDTTHQQQLYLSNLPDYLKVKREQFLWLPYELVAGFLFIYIFLPKNKPSAPIIIKAIPFVLFLAMLFFVDNKSYKEKTFKLEMSMMEASENNDWNQVLDLSKKFKDEPSRLIVMYTNMALFKLDKLGDEMYHYRDGDKKKKDPRCVYDPNNIMDSYIAGPFFYFNYGKINYCFRWCIENSVKYGESPLRLKYFVLSCAVNGQKKLANKYNAILAKSLFYRPLSMKLANIIDDPSLLEKDPNYSKIPALTKFGNNLDFEFSNMEQYLQLCFAYTAGGPPEMVELCLLANMDLKNPNQFWPAYFALTDDFKRPIPIHIQEAALLFNQLQGTHYIDQKLYNPSVIQRFSQFMSLVQQYNTLSEDAARNMFKPSFGDTYWYRFYFNQKQHFSTDSLMFAPYSS